MKTSPLSIRLLDINVPADQGALYALRLRILRPNRPPEAARFEGDFAPATRHWGAFSGPDLVGIVTVTENAGWQLRGMAVDTALQRGGVGTALLEAVQSWAASEGRDLWCNARVGALGFYARQGWRQEGEEFAVPDVGPHYIMRWEAPPQSDRG